MKVTLFRDLKEENWPSMHRYADALASGLRMMNEELRIKEYTVKRRDLTSSDAPNLYLTRYLYYPLKARKHQGDINHIVDHSYGHLVYALDPKKTVVTCHDLNPLKHEESWLNRRLFKYSLGGLKRAAGVIADSEATKKDLIKFLKIESDKIKVIPLGVGGKFRMIEDQKELERVRRKFNISPRPARRQAGRKIIIHVGGSAYNKNIEGIINAMSNIKYQISNIYFIKVGSDFTASQKSLIKKLDLEDDVKYLGSVSEDDLVALYNLADVFVFPSFYEGFGLPILEAMVCGTPVVTSNISSMPEVAGGAAVLVDPYGAESIATGISQVLRSNTAQYQGLVEKGLARAKKFTWQKTAEETLKVYQEIYLKASKYQSVTVSKIR